MLNLATSTRLRELRLGQNSAAAPKGVKKGGVIDDELLDSVEKREWWKFAVADDKVQSDLEAMHGAWEEAQTNLQKRFEDKVEKLQRGDELPPGVLKMVKVFVAVKRKLQPGDRKSHV